VQRSTSVGFTVNKIVYRGYEASREMQNILEASLKTTASLRVEHETALKQQDLEDIKLEKTTARAQRERELLAAEHSEKMRQQEVEHQARMKQKQAELEIEESALERKNDAQIVYFNKLHDMGVNLTQYLVAQHSKADRVIRVEMDGDNKSPMTPIMVNTA